MFSLNFSICHKSLVISWELDCIWNQVIVRHELFIRVRIVAVVRAQMSAKV